MHRRVTSMLREPILHFLLAGGLLYSAAAIQARATDPQRIVISRADVAQLTRRYVQQFGAPPSADRLAYLVDSHIRDEALYRQGVAAGLGQGDEVVRRRIIQKMEFLSEGDGEIGEPGQSQLQHFYHANAGRYRRPPRVSFTHVYFSPDRDSEAAARVRAVKALERLQTGAEQPVIPGDTFPDRQSFTLISPEEAGHVFGRSELTQALYEMPTGNWVGPVRSGYGWHLVRIEAREAASAPVFAEIEEELRTDWQNMQRARIKDERLAQLLRSYKIVRDDQAAPGVGG